MTTTRREFTTIALVFAGGAAVPVRSADAATFQAGDRRCATCDFWGGQRTAAADKSSVTVVDGTTGLCNNPQSPLYNRQSRADQVFNNGYRRWRELG